MSLKIHPAKLPQINYFTSQSLAQASEPIAELGEQPALDTPKNKFICLVSQWKQVYFNEKEHSDNTPILMIIQNDLIFNINITLKKIESDLPADIVFSNIHLRLKQVAEGIYKIQTEQNFDLLLKYINDHKEILKKYNKTKTHYFFKLCFFEDLLKFERLDLLLLKFRQIYASKPASDKNTLPKISAYNYSILILFIVSYRGMLVETTLNLFKKKDELVFHKESVNIFSKTGDFINTLNLPVAIQKKIYITYQNVFDSYFKNLINLDGINKSFNNSEFFFKKVSDIFMDTNQAFSWKPEEAKKQEESLKRLQSQNDYWCDLPEQAFNVAQRYETLSRSLKEQAFFLKQFPIYIGIAENRDAIEHLCKGYRSPQKFYEELNQQIVLFFSQKKDRELPILKQIIALRKNAWIDLNYKQFDTYEYCFHNIEKIAVSAFLPINTCQSVKHDLLPPSPQKGRRQISHPSSVITQALPLTEQPIKEEPEDIEEQKTPQLSLPEILPLCKDLLSKQLTSITKETHQKSREAWSNSRDHLENLLIVCSRFQNPMTKEQIYNAVCHQVNCTTLMLEQALKGILYHTNNNGTANHLESSHDFLSLFFGCQFGAHALSSSQIKNLFRTNLGEFLTRTLVNQIDTISQKQSLQTVPGLLKALHSWSSNEESYTTQDILRASASHLRNGLSSYQALCNVIVPLKQSDPLIEDVLEPFRYSHEEISASKLDNQDPVQKSLDELDLVLQPFLSEKNTPEFIQLHFKNITDNLLVRLRAELSHRNSLPLKELYLQYTTAFLLPQYIAEEFLYQLIALDEIPVNKQEIDHNLLELVKKLGYKEGHFKQPLLAFLKSGKSVRQLMRYRASPMGNKSSSKEQLDQLSALSFKQSLKDSSSLMTGEDAAIVIKRKRKGPAKKNQALPIQQFRDQIAANVETLRDLVAQLSTDYWKKANKGSLS